MSSNKKKTSTASCVVEVGTENVTELVPDSQVLMTVAFSVWAMAVDKRQDCKRNATEEMEEQIVRGDHGRRRFIARCSTCLLVMFVACFVSPALLAWAISNHG